ncbi:sensor histidine kinase [Indioceanicola profundi]|uniref:sensor histidine kinase n=1 Tax=Indioceanicola profundi TaxID=2220096 RepID=UPI000E6AABBF|nr:ATP-binding protein [Indioceanicola profundi]
MLNFPGWPRPSLPASGHTETNLLVPAAQILALAAVLVCALVYFASYAQNRISLRNEAHLVRSAVGAELRTLADVAVSYSWWGDAVDRVFVQKDIDWAWSNFGEALAESYHLTGVFILDEVNRTILASVGPDHVGEDALGYLGPEAAALAAEARKSSLTDVVPVSGIIVVGGKPNFIIASPFTHWEVKMQPPGRGVLLVVKEIDGRVLDKIADQFMITNLHWADANSDADVHLPLEAIDGRVAGHLSWAPSTPGTELMEFLVTGILGVVVLVFVLAARVLRAWQQTQSALQEALRSAEAASEAKSLFLATMSHELRTPLNAIIGFSELMRDGVWGPLPERYRGYAADIHASGYHLLGLVSDVLDFSKVAANRLELQPEPLEIAVAVSEAVRMVQADADTLGVDLRIDLPANPPRLIADAQRLRQMLLNLLSNAVRFTPAGGQVTVRASVGEHLRIEVVDTGCGMRPEDVPVALEPFRQVDGSLARRHQGTGLGLPLTRSLINLHGGELLIESMPGLGTTAALVFPASRLVAAEEKAPDGALV